MDFEFLKMAMTMYCIGNELKCKMDFEFLITARNLYYIGNDLECKTDFEFLIMALICVYFIRALLCIYVYFFDIFLSFQFVSYIFYTLSIWIL